MKQMRQLACRPAFSECTRHMVALVSALLCFYAPYQVARAQSPPAVSESNGGRPWERLPDGRVVIEIKGVKLAFDPDIDRGPPEAWPAVHSSVQFIPVRTPGARGLTFRQVIDDPARARAAFAKWQLVKIKTGNNPTSRGRFLGRYDRSEVIDSPGLY
jgi:hypothetical protein